MSLWWGRDTTECEGGSCPGQHQTELNSGWLLDGSFNTTVSFGVDMGGARRVDRMQIESLESGPVLPGVLRSGP